MSDGSNPVETAEDEVTEHAEGGSSLDIVSDGALIFAVGKGVSTVANFALQLLITRTLGAAAYGVFAYAQTITSIAGVFARFGTTESIMKFVPEFEDDRRTQGKFIGTAALTAIVGSLLVATILFFTAETINDYTLQNPLFAAILKIFSVFLPLQVLTQVVANVFRAYENAQYHIGILDVLVPVLNVTSVGVALAVGASIVGVSGAVAFAAGLALVVAVTIFLRKITVSLGVLRNRDEIFRFYNYSVPLTLTAAGALLYTQVDRLMVGFFLGDVEVAIYAIAISIATVLGLPLTGLNQLFPPVASKLHARESRDELQTMFSTVTRWSFSLSLLPAVVIFVFREEVLGIFGPEFVAGTAVLSLFVIAQLTRNAVGPSGYMLMMTDHQYVVMINRWILGTLNVVANYILILEYGFIGAAIASATTLAFVNCLRLIEIWILERYQPYSLAYLKPIAAATVTLLGLSLLRTSLLPQELPPVALAVIGGAIGCLVYAGIMLVLGLEEEDYRLYERLTS